MPASYNEQTIPDSTWRHGNVFIDDAQEVRIHYIDTPSASKPQKGVILLIHGFPETSYQFRKVINPFADAGYRVVVPDYRGAGESSHPRDGYDKVTVADDIYKLLTQHLGINEPVHVIGQDIGGMIAHAYAFSHGEGTKSVAWGECPLPGGDPYESGFKNSPGMWHFTFQQQLDLPELLTQGKEKIYLKHFYDRLCFNPAGIPPRDIDHYVTSFQQPGAMRAGFDLYRNFPRDAEDNKKMLKENGKSKVPAAALSGDKSLLGQVAEEQTRQFYETVDLLWVANSGHWTAEENPEGFVNVVLGFVAKHD